MEKRAVLAFGLSMVLLVAYMWVQERYFTPPPKSAETQSAPAERPKAPSPAPVPVPQTAPPAAAQRFRMPAAEAEARTARPVEQRASVEGPLYHGVISSDGGALKEWTLHYRGDKPMVVLGEQGPVGLVVTVPDAMSAGPVPMTITPDRATLSRAAPAQTFVLSGEDAGLRVRETLTFHADSYAIDVAMRLENGSGAARTVGFALPWNSRQDWAGTQQKFIGQRATEIVWSSGGRVQRIANLADVAEQHGEGDWVAMDSVWYLAALVPRSAGWQVALSGESQPKEGKNGRKEPAGRVTIALTAAPTVAPGHAWEGRALVYVGPKEYERLRALGLEETIDFGGFPIPRRFGGLPMEWLGVPILFVMKWVYRYVGNYGIAIILLTIVTKVLFYPLTVKSIRSMKAMQALQPQVNALRAKYKSDPQRAQREMMELYRKHRVNPMGGCLPMIAQIPIFYALYLALSVSVELQNASFLCVGRLFGVDLWICDLAGHDPTYVLPVLMGITMFVQQKMTPTAGDPRQAKMMLVMPFVFTFMFLNLPSGLVLYWTVSNMLQIVQQWYMQRNGGYATREAKDAGRA